MLAKVPPCVFSWEWKCQTSVSGRRESITKYFPHLLSGIIVWSLIEVSSSTELQQWTTSTLTYSTESASSSFFNFHILQFMLPGVICQINHLWPVFTSESMPVWMHPKCLLIGWLMALKGDLMCNKDHKAPCQALFIHYLIYSSQTTLGIQDAIFFPIFKWEAKVKEKLI